MSKQNKDGCCSHLFTRLKLLTSPKSIKKWYIFIYYFSRQQECKLSCATPSITSWLEWKGCCIQGPKGDLLHAVSTANRILGLFSREKGICYHRGNNFWKTVCEEMTHVLGSPQKSYLKWKTLQFEECSQWGLTAAVTPVAVLGSIRFPDHFGSCGKWIFSECTDIISNSSAIISDSCYELQHHFIPERGPPSIPSMPF